jgi:hypothetical protein
MKNNGENESSVKAAINSKATISLKENGEISKSSRNGV